VPAYERSQRYLLADADQPDLATGGRSMRTFAGIDWASEAHDICIVDERGARVVERRFAHDEAGVAGLCAALAGERVEHVAIERPDGLLVDRLLDAAIEVIAIHPNQVAAARDRYRTAGKDDRLDAFVLAELARTDMHRLRVLAPDRDETRALRALTRAHQDAVGARVALCNQLRAQLAAFWPGATQVFSGLDSPISLAFLERYPSPTDAHRLGPRRMQAFLDRHHYCGRKSADELLDRLRTAPAGRAGELEAEARRAVVLGFVAALRPLVEQIRHLEAQIAGALRAHPDGHIFRSFFRDPKSAITPARLLAEIGDCRTRYPTAASLAADAGMTPVTIQSGKRRSATFRYGCDARLRNAMATMADSTRHWHPWAGDTYHRATARGQDHPHAIRTLGRNWTLVLWRCWQDGVAYDPSQHRAATRLNQAKG
jgi:transposase